MLGVPSIAGTVCLTAESERTTSPPSLHISRVTVQNTARTTVVADRSERGAGNGGPLFF